MGQLEVRLEGPAQLRVPECGLVRYFAEQELDHDGELLGDLFESDGFALGCLSEGLYQVLVGFRVLELDGLVIVVTGINLCSQRKRNKIRFSLRYTSFFLFLIPGLNRISFICVKVLRIIFRRFFLKNLF